MKYFAMFDEVGFPTAFYCEEIHGDAVPLGVIEISEDQWRDFIDNPGSRRWQNSQVVEYVPPTVPVDLVAYAAAKRWEKENGGINVGGAQIATDDRSKVMISGARVAAENDPDFSTEWKAADGSFVTVNAAMIVAISDAMLAHVSNCFALETRVLAQIEAETITTTEEIDAAFA